MTAETLSTVKPPEWQGRVGRGGGEGGCRTIMAETLSTDKDNSCLAMHLVGVLRSGHVLSQVLASRFSR